VKSFFFAEVENMLHDDFFRAFPIFDHGTEEDPDRPCWCVYTAKKDEQNVTKTKLAVGLF